MSLRNDARQCTKIEEEAAVKAVETTAEAGGIDWNSMAYPKKATTRRTRTGAMCNGKSICNFLDDCLFSALVVVALVENGESPAFWVTRNGEIVVI